jgi:23S rRNA (uridine2552-2'-O)-methyltransferase
MAKSVSSHNWLKEHFSDEYVRLAQKQGYRSRAVFKLAEIDEKDQIFRPGITVVDLGAAPGGWAQFAFERLGRRGQIIALDILPMEELEGVTFIQGDFTEDRTLVMLLGSLHGDRVDLVLSDMAPNMSGAKAIDQPKSMYLAELALDTTARILKPSGNFLVKLFQGAGFDEYQHKARKMFSSVTIRKPKASRPRSREVYLLAKGFKSCGLEM